MIRIRPGRSWRHNPAYATELRALTAPAARDYTGERLLDVLGIEVDGVDIAAGVGEAPVVAAVDELAAAILRVGEGEPAAQATVGPGPTELVLEPRGTDVLLTLVTLRPPARVLAGGLLLDSVTLRAAALAAAQSLLLDLLDASPALEGSPLLRRLSRACSALARTVRRRAPEWPPAGAAKSGFVVKGGKAPARVDVQVPLASAARLAARSLVPWSPFAPLLGPGSVSLRLGRGPVLTVEAAPWLVLRELLGEATALVHALESGERTATLRAGPLELRCDLTGDEVRAPGWKSPASVSPASLAEAIAAAAKAFAEKALALGARRQAGRTGQEEPLADLRAAADELLAHCRDLRSGDLRRAADAVRAPPPRRVSEPQRALLSGRVRRLLYKTAAQTEVGPLLPGGLLAFPSHGGGALVLQGPAGLQALDLESGARLWHLPGAASEPGSAARTGAGDLFASHGDALLRLDAATGAVRWRRSMKGASPLVQAVHGGCVRALESGLSLVRDNGTLAFRARLDGPPLACALAHGILLAQLPGGLLLGLDAHDGAELWRRRCGVRAGPLCVGDASHALESAARSGTRSSARGPSHGYLVWQDLRGARTLLAFDVASGDTLWERPLPPGGPEEPGPVTLCGDLACVHAGEGVRAIRIADGAPRFSIRLPWGPTGKLLGLDDPALHTHARPAQPPPAHAPALIAAGPGASALRLDDRGAILWTHASEGEPAEPLAPCASGPTLLCAGGPADLLDLTTGLLLARPAARDVDAAALLPDLALALHFRDGGLVLLRLTMHLSLV